MSSKTSIRLGVLVPAGNVVHEREFARLCAPGVSASFRGFAYPAAGSASFCDELAGQMAAPIAHLRAWGAELILVGCTTASMTCSAPEYQARLEAAAGLPVVTAAKAARQAIAALGLRAISVATPYGAANNHVVSNFIVEQGIQVAAIRGLGLDRTPQTWIEGAPTLTPERVLGLALSVDCPGSDGLYLPCTGMASLETIEAFERLTGKPAFSSVQAGYWASLHRLGYDGRRPGFGRLLATWNF